MSLLDLLCPTRCAGCGASGASACPECRRGLTVPARAHRPTPCPPGLPPLWVIAAYEGPVRGLLLGFKERGAAGLARVLAVPLATAARAAMHGATGPVLLVPVPSARAAVRARGDDVIGLLAAGAARRLRLSGVDCRAASVLGQRRAVADSAGLSAAMRAANLREALGVRPGRAARLEGATVVVVDDLVTTGATLCEARRALAGAGADVIGAAAVAATLRYGRPCPDRSGSTLHKV